MAKSTPNSNPEHGQALPKNIVIWLVAAAAGLLVAILLIVSITRPGQPAAVNVAPATAALPDLVLDNSEAERRALAKSQLQRLQHDGENVRRLLDECEQELAAWDREVESELAGKRGQAVAADGESLAKFSAVYRQPRAKKSELLACRDRVDAVLEPVMAALSSGSLYVPTGDTTSQLVAERQFAQKSQQALQESRQNALSVLSGAERKGISGNRTLKDALNELEARQAQTRVDEITARQEAARRESTKMIAESRADQELAFGREEADRIKNETSRELERRKADDALKGQQATHDILKTRAADPAVQAKYTPFLGKGKFGSANNVPGLLSFNYMNHIGALESVENFVNAASGRKVVFRSGVHPDFAWNDRKRWTYPATDEEWQEFGRRYQEFRDLAPFWIELNLLRD